MMHNFAAECFVTYARRHHHADKVPKENCYVTHLILLYFFIVYVWNLTFTNIVTVYDKTNPLNLKLYYMHIKITLEKRR
jgi:hypothetical protein